jgi:hypothetical protein
MEKFGALMPKDPKIMSRDWRSLGYWPVYRNGKKICEKDYKNKDEK